MPEPLEPQVVLDLGQHSLDEQNRLLAEFIDGYAQPGYGWFGLDPADLALLTNETAPDEEVDDAFAEIVKTTTFKDAQGITWAFELDTYQQVLLLVPKESTPNA